MLVKSRFISRFLISAFLLISVVVLVSCSPDVTTSSPDPTPTATPMAVNIAEEYKYLLESVPYYFGVDTSNGLDITVCQFSQGGYKYGILPHDSNRESIWEDHLNMNTVDLEQIKVILATYDLENVEINIVPWQHPFSSYILDCFMYDYGETPEEHGDAKFAAFEEKVRYIVFGEGDSASIVPTVNMNVISQKDGVVTVKIDLVDRFDGAGVFSNGPFEVRHLVNGTWETIDSSMVNVSGWMMNSKDFTSSTAEVSLVLPEKWVSGDKYKIIVPLTTAQSKGKEYSVSVEFAYMGEKTVYEWTNHYPKDLAQTNYGGEAALLDGAFFTKDNYVLYDGEGFFERLLSWVDQDISFVMRFLETQGDSKETLYNDFVFDGEKYTIRTLTDKANGTIVSKDYKYLLRFEGPKETEDAEYDYFERYVLTNSADVTWEDIIAGKYTDYRILVLNPIVYPVIPDVKKDVAKITLEFKGEVISEINSKNTCSLICEIVSTAEEYHMEQWCECSWYTADEELQMIFWYED